MGHIFPRFCMCKDLRCVHIHHFSNRRLKNILVSVIYAHSWVVPAYAIFIVSMPITSLCIMENIKVRDIKFCSTASLQESLHRRFKYWMKIFICGQSRISQIYVSQILSEREYNTPPEIHTSRVWIYVLR